MKSLEEEITALEADKAQKLLALKTKHEILAILPVGDYHPPFVHNYKLHGSVGSIDWKGTNYSSISDGKNPDPALPVTRYKDRCTSFRPTSSITDEELDKGDTMPVYPVTVRFETESNTSYRVSYEWFAEVNGEVWHMGVCLPVYVANIAHVEMKVNYYAGEGAIRSIDQCRIIPYVGGTETIRWATGTPQWANSFTLYWYEGTVIDLPGLCKISP